MADRQCYLLMAWETRLWGYSLGSHMDPRGWFLGGELGKGAEEKDGQGGVRNWRSYREGSG